MESDEKQNLNRISLNNVWGQVLNWQFQKCKIFNNVPSLCTKPFKKGDIIHMINLLTDEGTLNILQGILAFRDFTIRDPHYFVNLFEAKFHDFEGKKNFGIFFLDFLDFFTLSVDKNRHFPGMLSSLT